MRKPFGQTNYSAPWSAAGARLDLRKGGYADLVAGTTYYFPLGGSEATAESAHAQWPSTIIITGAVIEDSNLTEADSTWYSTVAGEWLAENPTSAYVPVAGTGVSATAGTIAATGNAAGGGAIWNLSGAGSTRKRLKVVVGATGGLFRVAPNGKA